MSDFDGIVETRPVRGRVVMVVDNGVVGDSRVQKAARSAADAGWEVVLLGRSPFGKAESWRLGGAEVRLLVMPDPLARRRHEFRRAWLRWPLAYPPNGIAAHRAAWVKAWRVDLRMREALVTLAEREGRLTSGKAATRRRLLRAETIAAKITRRWVSFRSWQLTRARTGRKFRNPWDRAYTLFWRWVKGDGAWRRLEPGLWDYELAYGPVIDELAPDVIHAHDFRMLGVAARAKIRARVAGRDLKLVWDAHEFVPGIPAVINARWLPAHCGYEREYAPYADAVVTVSDTLAELLRKEHRLVQLPAVVLNAPQAADSQLSSGADQPDLRAHCGIGPDVPLLVYSGAAAAQRGLATMVEALPTLVGVHVAFVVNKPSSGYVRGLVARAGELGVSDRLHVFGYVHHGQVVGYLAGADVGVIPIHHWTNHEIALITKFFEYSHARLPIVVSDVRTMSAMVRTTGQGEVFRAEDVDDFIRATRAVLADPRRYRAAYDKPGLLAEWTWEAQAGVLDAVYSRLLPQRNSPVAGRTLAGV